MCVRNQGQYHWIGTNEWKRGRSGRSGQRWKGRWGRDLNIRVRELILFSVRWRATGHLSRPH